MLKIVENKENLANTDIEMYLIGMALTSPLHWPQWSFVKPEDFSDSFAGEVWRRIGEKVLAGLRTDARMLSLEMYENPEDQKKCFGVLLEWSGQTIPVSFGDNYAAIVKDYAGRRRLIADAQEAIAAARNTSGALNLAEISAQFIGKLSTPNADEEFISAYQIGLRVIENLAKPIECSPTGLPRFDGALGGGFYKNKFYGIGARMKAGKSLFMATIAYKMAVIGRARVLYLCLEMGSEESTHRILAMQMGVNAFHFLKPSIRSTPWFEKKVQDANVELKNSNLYFRSRPRMTLDDLKATIARAALSGKIDGVIVDYMQLVEGKEKGQSTAEHYDNVAQTLAECVKRYPIWVLSAAQLNREGKIRGSDGMLMACDMAFALTKKDGEELESGGKIADRAWIETLASRYMPYSNIGSEEVPGYEIDTHNGPIFVEL